MTDKEIQEGNRLIAEFMGNSYINRHIPYWAFRIYDFDTLDYRGYEYHSSWDWLMPACNKFDNLDIDLQEYDTYVDHCENIDNAVTTYEIEPAFLMLVEGIKWYNKIKKK